MAFLTKQKHFAKLLKTWNRYSVKVRYRRRYEHVYDLIVSDIMMRKLDAKAGKKAARAAIVIGTVGALIIGSGMSLIMSEFGTLLGNAALPVGIVMGIVGMIVLALAYPCYRHILKQEQERIGPEVLRLSEELLKF